ncbi:GNAT family N-acetyltransferase [Paenibacillus mesophilus]|uniref:GNAT family N-acetyltransferase n=1 Tax=Paenibacillus mesophilus TaxID=2582849 RepID=UPI00130528EA|nr:GNAT family N-acetyltransferase [Paenibacillus mesophilus]
MEEIRLLRPDEFRAAAALADLVFRDADHKSMGDAYPNAFSPSLLQSYGAFVDGAIVSFVGFVPSVIWIGDAHLNVYSIGAVCTHPDHRGKGYAGAILELIREHSRQAGVPIILVSGNRGMYERFGCRTFGNTASYLLDGEAMAKLANAPAAREAVLRPFAPTDWFAVRRLAGQRAVRFEQSLWDLASMIRAEPTASNSKLIHRVWVAERGGEAAAFAVIAVPNGRIAPRGNPMLIEWAGDPVLAAALAARGAGEARAEKLRAVVPRHESEFAGVLEQAGCAGAPGKQSGTIAVVDPEALLVQLAPWLEAKNAGAFSGLRFRLSENGGYVVEREGRSWELTPEAFISLVFDRNGAESISSGGEISPTADLFPIPFPYPAGLNFV